jgi:hypothetical protein
MEYYQKIMMMYDNRERDLYFYEAREELGRIETKVREEDYSEMERREQ